MRLLLRFGAPLVAALAALAALLTPVADNLISRWFQHDVEMRSQLIFSSVHDSLAELVRSASRKEIKVLFDRIAEDERVSAVGWCGPNTKMQLASKNWLRNLECKFNSSIHTSTFQTEALARGPDTIRSFSAFRG